MANKTPVANVFAGLAPHKGRRREEDLSPAEAAVTRESSAAGAGFDPLLDRAELPF